MVGCVKMLFKYLTRLIRILKSSFITYSTVLFALLLVFYACLTILKVTQSSHPLSTILYDMSPNATSTLMPPVKTIYFHETSGKGILNSRQACAVESASKTHSNWHVNVIFVGSLREERFDKKCLQALKKYQNLKLYNIDLREYAKETPLESIFSKGVLNKSRWQISHTSDALRYLTLYKWGGVYLDLDVVVAKSFDTLAPNWAARESQTAIAAGAISFSKDKLGREVAKVAISDFKNNFRGDLWGHNGPGVITRVLKKICKTKIVSKMSASNCKGFEVYGQKLFYPINWKHAKDYFVSKKLVLGQPYIYHIWNRLTESYKVQRNSLYTKLARKYCPRVYEAYGDRFGT